MEIPESYESETCKVNHGEQGVYSGCSKFLYSSRLDCSLSLAEACKILVQSDAFAFALDNKGQVYFKDNACVRVQALTIKSNIQGTGMTISGHQNFLNNQDKDSVSYSFLKALNLLLSERKLFNGMFGYPSDSARVYLRPMAIQAEGDEEYELLLPHLKISSGGVITIVLEGVFGFEDLTSGEVVFEEVNKSLRNLESVLCDKALHKASVECQISQMSFSERMAQKETFIKMMDSSLESPTTIDFLEEELALYELVHTDQITLTDVARNVLSMVARSLASRKVKSEVNWRDVRKSDPPVGRYWYGKPLIGILGHTGQKGGAEENWSAHKSFVNSVMVRAGLSGASYEQSIQLKDLRCFNDFNHFYSEPVSLILSSSQVSSFIDRSDGYTFDNLISDAQILNEVAHYMIVFYAYASSALDDCIKSTDVTRIELQVLSFEESLYSLYKYGEIADYIEEVKQGTHLSMMSKIFHKKVEAIKKSIELDQKIASEAFTRRVTVIFGIIASAALSPELMQPLVKLAGFSLGEQWSKVIGLVAAMAAVTALLIVTHYGLKLIRGLVRFLRG